MSKMFFNQALDLHKENEALKQHIKRLEAGDAALTYSIGLDLQKENDALKDRIKRLEEALKALLIAVTFADPPKNFNGVLCNEALVPIGFVDLARAALKAKEAKL